MRVFLTQITVPLPVFMVLKSVTVPLLQMAGDNLMDACIQKSLAHVSRRLRSPGCCQVTFNSEQICRMCCLAVKCLPRVLGADCQDKEISFICMTATRQYPPLRRGIFVAGGSGLLTRRCAEKAPKYSR